MYWQVYMHKTVVSAEYMLIHILRRAKHLAQKGHEIFANSSLAYFLNNNITKNDFEKDNTALNHFAAIDDNDIWSAIKEWQNSDDDVLSMLANGLINRGLFKIEISATPFSSERIENERARVAKQFNLSEDELDYMVYSEVLSNNAYNTSKQNIMLLKKDGEIVDLPSASDNLNISALAQPVEKYFLCFPSY